MFITKPEIMNNWFNELFKWLEKCENEFGFNLEGYGLKRIYGFLAERYMPFWFRKYSKIIEWPWVFSDTHLQ